MRICKKCGKEYDVIKVKKLISLLNEWQTGTGILGFCSPRCYEKSFSWRPRIMKKEIKTEKEMINSVKISEAALKALLRGERVTIPIVCGISVEGEIGKTVTTHINLEVG